MKDKIIRFMQEKIKKYAEVIGFWGLIAGFLGAIALLYSSVANYGSYIEAPDGKRYYSLFLDPMMLRIGILLITLGFLMQIIERIFINNKNLNKRS